MFGLENVSRNSGRRPAGRINRSFVQVVRERVVGDGRNLSGRRHEACKLMRTDFSVAETLNLKMTEGFNFLRLG